jgi:ribokinase
VLLGCVGDDLLAKIALAGPREAGAETSAVGIVPGPTGLAMVVVRPDGEKTILLATNANDVWRPADEEQALRAIAAAGARSVLVADMEAPCTVVERALRAARERGLTTLLDPSPAARVGDEVLALADDVTPNPSETKAIVGVEVRDAGDAEHAARALRERGARGVLVKLPDGGCLVADETMHALVPAPHGVAASSIAVERYGSRASYPGRGELEAMVRRIASLVAAA